MNIEIGGFDEKYVIKYFNIFMNYFFILFIKY